jgi:hypothetical protein
MTENVNINPTVDTGSTPQPVDIQSTLPGTNAAAGTTNTNGVPGSLPGETREETKARLYKVMVDGAEMEVDEAELLKGYSHGRTAAMKMEEAANSKKEAAELLRLMKSQPKSFFEKLGMDYREFAAQIFNEDLIESTLTPEQKKLRDYERMFSEHQERERAAKEQYEREQLEIESARVAEELQGQMLGALNDVGIPSGHRESLYRMVTYMQRAVAAGYENIDPKIVAAQVKKDFEADLRALTGINDIDQLEQMFGSDFIKKIGKASVAKTAPLKTVVPKSVNEQRSETPQSYDKFNRNGKRSTKDFFKR